MRLVHGVQIIWIGKEIVRLKIGILGTGTWGVALGRMLYNAGHEVIMWSAIGEEVETLAETRRHRNLPGMVIPEGIGFTAEMAEVCAGRDMIVFAVPSVFVRATAEKAKRFIPEGQIVVDVAKGIEEETLLSMTGVLKDVMGEKKLRYVALSGPTHAEEVAADLLTTIVSASEDTEAAKTVQRAFTTPFMRVYTNVDVKGVELSGALKNIVALASGITKGLGYGDNARAALITRGVAEITRLGLKMGCLEQTFSGLAGVGDLIVTATSEHSRNNRAGELIGSGKTPEEAVKEVGMVVEGINALPAAMRLTELYGVEMPIIQAVNEIIHEHRKPEDAVRALMAREEKSELNRSPLQIRYEQAVAAQEKGTGMRRVITYGTFDLLHYGHINLLQRAKALGDYLIVALSTDDFNWNDKHKKTYFTYEQRKKLLEAVKYVDLVIPEENWEQKRTDMRRYRVDTFVMGDDWEGKFDFLKEEGVDVVYLPRTPEISTSQIKKDLYGEGGAGAESRLNHDDLKVDGGK